VRKISPPPGFDPRAVQAVASCYTDWAIPAFHWHKQVTNKNEGRYETSVKDPSPLRRYAISNVNSY
jgi:hypothetical protein